MSTAMACPCGSGKKYRECCRPFHRFEAEPPDCPTLVRARYAAFALKEVAFLWRTLDPEHPDSARPEAEVARELREMGQRHRFVGVRILDSAPADPPGLAEVLFLAQLFEAGKERSFVERAAFRRHGEGWRYLRGQTRPARERDAGLSALTLATFSA